MILAINGERYIEAGSNFFITPLWKYLDWVVYKNYDKKWHTKVWKTVIYPTLKITYQKAMNTVSNSMIYL